MNNLNSIILEGNVKGINKEKDSLVIELVCERTFKNNNGEYDKEYNLFEIAAYGNLANVCEKYCAEDRGIRVVGRLKQTQFVDENGKWNSKVIVIAEHIEFKPVNKD